MGESNAINSKGSFQSLELQLVFFSACVCASFACFNFVTMCMCAWLHPRICTVFVVDWQQVSSASFAQAKFEFNSLVFCSLANTTSKFWHDSYRQHLLCFLSSQLVLSSLLLFYFPSPPSFYLYPTFVFSPTSLALSAQLLFFSTFPLLHSSVLPLFFWPPPPPPTHALTHTISLPAASLQ